MNIYKMCSDCYRLKPLDAFHTDKTGAAMVRGNCKACECTKRRYRYYRTAKNWREKMKTAITLLVLLGLFSGSSKAASTDTIKEAQSKVVELHITRIEPTAAEAKKNKRRVENFTGHAVCSGAFVSSTGDILTARHCTEGAGIIDAVTADGQEYRALVSSTSGLHDLALIHIDKSNTPHFKLAKSLYQGQKIYVMGSPLGIGRTLNTGIVAKLNGDVTYMDCSALPGNSGGPAFDEDGDMVGVVTAGFIVLFGTTHLNIMQSIDAIYGFATTGK